MRRTLSVRLSVCLSVRPVIGCSFFYFTAEPSYERTSKIEKLLFSLMGQRHVCTFRHALRAAYRTAISAVQDSCYIFGGRCKRAVNLIPAKFRTCETHFICSTPKVGTQKYTISTVEIIFILYAQSTSLIEKMFRKEIKALERNEAHYKTSYTRLAL